MIIKANFHIIMAMINMQDRMGTKYTRTFFAWAARVQNILSARGIPIILGGYNISCMGIKYFGEYKTSCDTGGVKLVWHPEWYEK